MHRAPGRGGLPLLISAMSDIRPLGRLELVTVVCVVVVATVVGVLFVRRYALDPGSVVEVSRGMQLPEPAGYTWHSYHRTVVLALHVGCLHCENNMGFYERLVGLERSHQLSAHILAVFPDAQEEVQRALGGRLVAQQSLANVNLGKLGVRGTPTLILVDGNGQVQDVWVGELPNAEQEEIVRSIQPAQSRNRH